MAEVKVYIPLLDRLPKMARKKAERLAMALMEQCIEEEIAYGIAMMYAVRNNEITKKATKAIKVSPKID